MIHELRTYLVGAGRTEDMDVLLTRDCTPVFRRSGVPVPLGAWRALAGPRLPAFIWLLAWESLEARNKAWAAFGADTQWQQLRRDAHKASELTARVDTQFLAAWPQLAVGANLSLPGGLYELWLMRVHSGLGGPARQAFLEHDRKVLEQLGGHVEAGFDLLSGEELPTAAVLIRWPDVVIWGAALTAYDTDPDLRARRIAEYEAHGVDVFTSCDRHLLASASAFGAA